jgi:hypothetical protein
VEAVEGKIKLPQPNSAAEERGCWIRFRLDHFLPDRYADDEENQAYDEKEKEQEFGNAGGIAEAIPVNPNNAAISAITRKIAAHFNILITS